MYYQYTPHGGYKDKGGLCITNIPTWWIRIRVAYVYYQYTPHGGYKDKGGLCITNIPHMEGIRIRVAYVLPIYPHGGYKDKGGLCITIIPTWWMRLASVFMFDLSIQSQASLVLGEERREEEVE